MRHDDRFWNDGMRGGMHDGMRHVHDGFWGGPFHLIVLLVVLALLVATAVWLTRRLSPGGLVPVALGSAGAASAADPAVAALRLRYASGGLPREEFLQRMVDLTGGTGTASPGDVAPEADPG